MRTGLAISFLYAGYSALSQPQLWIDFVPHFLTAIVPAKLLLDILSISQLVLAVWLLWGRHLWLSATVAATMLIGIVIFNPHVFIITFRDLGLGFCALALPFLDPKSDRFIERLKQWLTHK